MWCAAGQAREWSCFWASGGSGPIAAPYGQKPAVARSRQDPRLSPINRRCFSNGPVSWQQH